MIYNTLTSSPNVGLGPQATTLSSAATTTLLFLQNNNLFENL
mgnify:FL=1